MENILIAIDFHEKTEMLLDKTVALTKPHGSKLWLLHVAAPDPDFVGYDVGPQYIRDNRAGELKKEHQWLQKHADQLNEKGIEAEGLLIQGATVEMILQEADKLHIDLIVSGYHNHSSLYNTFFGSTSTSIIHKSSIPVLIVPFGA
uniref:Universal stress protein n=1 Tax=Roseihalotalea indica TaxID=2867963 RepID=A0AA49GTN9_9BACT|nr:universal stress protein [Tunicatimonas sp. TK19036]